MNDANTPRSLRDYLEIVRRHVWLIAAITLIAAVVAFALASAQTKQYSASATIDFIDPLATAGIVGGGASNASPTSLAARGTARLTQASTLAKVKRQLGTTLSMNQLRDDISAVTDPNTFVVTVTATARRAPLVAQLANTVVEQAKADSDAAAARAFARLADNFQLEIANLSPAQRQNQLIVSAIYDNYARAQALAHGGATAAEVESTAQIPSAPASPKPGSDAIFGAVLGLVLGLAVVAVREAFDRRLRSPHEIELKLNLPIVGQVREETLGTVASEAGRTLEIDELDLESFRILRTNVDFLGAGQPLTTIAVTSALPQEGKTTVATSLAFASTAAGRRTLLVECDLRRPRLPERLAIARSPGLTDFLTGQAEASEVLRTVGFAARQTTTGRRQSLRDARRHPPRTEELVPMGELTCIPAGSRSVRPTELLGSSRFREFLQEVSEVYDTVILDTSPILPVADTLEVVPIVDGVLICLRASRTTQEQVSAARAALDRFPDRPMAVVLTGARDSREYHSYYYPYAYDYRADQPAERTRGKASGAA